MEILKYRYNQGKRNNLNFFRDSIGNEIDVIYSIGQHLLPIEIKAGETVSTDFFKGFKIFEKLVSTLPFGKIVIYNGEREETRKDIKIITIRKLIKTLDGIK